MADAIKLAHEKYHFVCLNCNTVNKRDELVPKPLDQLCDVNLLHCHACLGSELKAYTVRVNEPLVEALCKD